MKKDKIFNVLLIVGMLFWIYWFPIRGFGFVGTHFDIDKLDLPSEKCGLCTIFVWKNGDVVSLDQFRYHKNDYDSLLNIHLTTLKQNY